MLRKRFPFITVFSVLLCVSLVFMVEAASMWSQTYGGTDSDFGRSVVETSDGGYAIAGYTRSYGVGDWDFWLVKTDASGTMQWNQTYGGTGEDIGYSVVQTGDGGYAIAGYTYSFGAGWSDVWLVKTDSAGTVQWNQTYGGTSDDFGWSVVETSDGGYAIAGETWSYGAGLWDVWLVKTDSAGTVQWNQTYGGTSGDHGGSVVETGDGGYAIAGSTLSYGTGGSDFWLIKTDASGTAQWNQTYGGTYGDYGSSVVETSDGGYAITGYTESYDAGNVNVLLVKTYASGTVEFMGAYGGTNSDRGYSLVQTSDGGYAIAGRTRSYGDASGDVWLIKTDAVGTVEWNQTYGGTGEDIGYSVVQTGDGGYAIAGYTRSYGAGSYDFWLVKTDENGVVPESSWVILPLLLIATLSIFISKKKLLHTRSKNNRA